VPVEIIHGGKIVPLLQRPDPEITVPAFAKAAGYHFQKPAEEQNRARNSPPPAFGGRRRFCPCRRRPQTAIVFVSLAPNVATRRSIKSHWRRKMSNRPHTKAFLARFHPATFPSPFVIYRRRRPAGRGWGGGGGWPASAGLTAVFLRPRLAHPCLRLFADGPVVGRA